MQPRHATGDTVNYLGTPSTILRVGCCSDGTAKYLCRLSPFGFEMWVLERDISPLGQEQQPARIFNHRRPHLVVVDSFLANPDRVRAMALEQDFAADPRSYKGQRTSSRFLWPFLKEEFERLLGARITDWLHQPQNGTFQLTGFDDPLVWHSDTQDYAAAIYLTPDAPVTAGTSFWRDRRHGSRRALTHPLERQRFSDMTSLQEAAQQVWTEFNLVHPDNWELVDRVGGVYNRLVLWDAKLIHSASSYEGLSAADRERARLVQLFFFSVS